MKGSLYRERDYAFGQVMLTLRTLLGLTQTEVADLLGVTRRAVGDWEGGLTYPKAEHLKQFVVIAFEHQAFPAGREAAEVRALWQAARQKVLLDETWLGTLLPDADVSPASQPVEETIGAAQAPAPPARSGPRLDWGDALAVTSFYGREWELDLLSEWVVDERCRVVSVLGQGGIGKSALATKVMHHVAEGFEVVIWRSLRDVPSCEALLDDCLQVLAPQALRDMSASLESRQGLLLEYLRSSRVLLVYDNLESFLDEGENTGHMRPGYEGFARVLRRIAETEHQSCLLLTSREKPGALVPLEGSRAPVRALRLARLDADSCRQLLAEKDVAGTASELAQLIELYAGNPLALKIVAQTIVDLFDGRITLFLEQGEVVFGSVRELVREQFDRLSAVEQGVLLWLAILREPVSMEELLSVLATPLSRGQVMEAVEALRRRSLIERGHLRGSFTLQSVVLEYATGRLIAEASREIEQGTLSRLIEHGLELAKSREDVRQTQQRLIMAPLLAQVRSVYPERAEVEQRLLALLDQLRARADYAQGYGPANVLALLREQRGHLRGLDLSQLAIRGAYLQGVEMQDASLAEALLRDTTFTEAFDATRVVAISRNGTYWAAGSRRGKARVWQEGGKLLHLAWQAHTGTVAALAFSPDGRTLATGSWNGAITLWDLESGTLLWTSWHTTNIQSLAFAPDGSLLASGGNDATVRLWEATSGTHRQTLSGKSGPVYALAWSPDGSLLASGSFDGQIRLWEIQKTQPATCVHMLTGHTTGVIGLAFAPDGSTLASGSWDRTVKLWDVESLRLRETLTGHTDRVFAVAWSPDGRLLASCGWDQTIWIWDVERGSYRIALHGHTAVVYDIAFTPDSRSLLSGSADGTLRVWDVERGQCVRIIQGYAVSLYDVAWSPDGTQLASAGSDRLMTIWEADGRTPPRVLRGHSGIVDGVAWSPDGQLLASSGWDNVVRVSDATTGEARQLLRDPDHVDTSFYGVAWSPDGQWLASASYQQGVHVWEVTTGTRRWVNRAQPSRIRRVAWSTDGTRLASCSDDGSVCLWEASDGTLLTQLQGHHGMVASVAWSPDGTRLASGGGSRGSGELVVWDAQSGERLQALSEPSAIVYALAWSPTGAVLVWDLQSGKQLRTLRRDRPHERLNITGIRGVTEAQKTTLRALGAIEDSPS